MTDLTPVQWAGCYDGSWKDLIVPKAFAHPAKASRALLVKIYDELFRIGAVKVGDTIVDPFGGIGTTGIEGASRGCRVICCELEPKFVELGRQNFAIHRTTWDGMCRPQPIMMQGDSRRLRDVLQLDGAMATISSPPYVSGGNHPDQTGSWKSGKFNGHDYGSPSKELAGYGKEDGQMGQMPAGDVSAVLSSPPYAEGHAKGHPSLGSVNKDEWGADGRDIAASRNVTGSYGTTSGQLAALSGGSVEAVISSPPYAGDSGKSDSTGHERAIRRGDETGFTQGLGCFKSSEAYGDSEGQLGRMDSGSVEAIVSSPPYAEIASGSGGLNTKPPKHPGQQGGRSSESASQDTDSRYGSADGQLAKMGLGDVDALLSSPPSANDTVNERKGIDMSKSKVGSRPGGPNSQARIGGYSDDASNISNLQSGSVAAVCDAVVDGVIASPPWEKGADGTLRAEKFKDPEAFARSMSANDGQGARSATTPTSRLTQMERNRDATYGESEGQIGNQQGETFWSAAKQIVSESFAILKPGGVAVWIVKGFVRKGQYVDFPADWRKLCEHIGFETFQIVHAMLVSEERRPDLFDGERRIVKARKSFFRRLAESKGSPAIDFEVVLFMRKPL